MRITFILLMLTFITSAYAESPYDKFSTADNYTNKVTVEWQSADDIQTACNKQRTDNGEQPYTYAVQACSIWYANGQKSTCTIITSKNVSMWSIGHEIRHCFQGAFHK
jgi:hypothetical protein